MLLSELDALLVEVLDLEATSQDTPGPLDSMLGQLSENVPTLNEYLRLLKVVGTLLEMLGAEPNRAS